jgi:hypothetical protein
VTLLRILRPHAPGHQGPMGHVIGWALFLASWASGIDLVVDGVVVYRDPGRSWFEEGELLLTVVVFGLILGAYFTNPETNGDIQRKLTSWAAAVVSFDIVVDVLAYLFTPFVVRYFSSELMLTAIAAIGVYVAFAAVQGRRLGTTVFRRGSRA